ncbi:MAG: SpoIIE family protein phosphatase [Leptospiraceae bacterium]|nr:SpoIIE family protein phosphatase [Leptospiraceae bacterium]
MKKISNAIVIWVTRNFSYGTSVALNAAVSGVLVVVFVLYYASAVKIPMTQMMLYSTFAMIIAAFFFHGLMFGILHRLGFSGITKGLRLLNRYVLAENGKLIIDPEIPKDKMVRLLHELTIVPFGNAVTAVFFILTPLIGILITAALDDVLTGKIMLRIAIAAAIAFFIHGGFSLVLTESSTGAVRSELKKQMHLAGVEFEHKSITTVRLKLFLFIVLLIMTLVVSNSLTYYNRENMLSVLNFSLLAILTSSFMAYLVFNIIYRSLEEISNASDDLRNGGDGLLFPRSLDREFLELSSGFIETARTIRSYQHNLEHMVAERTNELQKANEELKDKDAIIQMELDFASEIQKGIIPHALPEWNGLRFAAHWKAMEKVSGDFYDIFSVKGSHLGILIADVSGHGVPAALITTMAKVSFARASEQFSEAADIFRQVNRQLTETIHTQDYLTAFLLIADEEHNVSYSNASHPLAKVWRFATNKIDELDTDGLFIGAMPEAETSYEQKTMKLDPGDRIYLYTDGIPEYRNKEGEEFGNTRFDDAIRDSSKMSINESVNYILSQLNQFVDGVPANDDITILAIEADRNYGKFQLLVNRAYQKLEEGEKVEAADLLSQAIEIYASNQNALRNAGILHCELNRLDTAKSYLQRYTEFNSGNAEVWLWLSNVALKEQNYVEAKKHAETSVSLRPGYAAALYNLAIVAIKEQDAQTARTYFEKAIQFDPNNPVLRNAYERFKNQK